MSLYVFIGAPLAFVLALVLTLFTKKQEGVCYGTLDKVGIVTNIVLIPVYLCVLPISLFLGLIAAPRYDGWQGLVGTLVSIVIASAPILFSLGLGASVALRRRGKRVLSFVVQFAGVLGLVLAFVLTACCEGILAPLN